MRGLAVYAAVALAAMSMAGCGGEPGSSADAAAQSGSSADAAAQPRADSQPQQRKAGAGDAGNVFAPLENDLEKARGVQDTVDRQAERLRKQIEKAEGAADEGDD